MGIANPEDHTTFELKVTNAGPLDGDEVIQAYFVPGPDIGTPLRRQLFDFKRIHLMSGHSSKVSFNVSPTSLQVVDPMTGNLVRMPGRYILEFTNGVDAAINASIDLVGTKVVVERFPNLSSFGGGDQARSVFVV